MKNQRIHHSSTFRHPSRWALRTLLAASLAVAAVGLSAQGMSDPVDINNAEAREIAKAMRGVGMGLARRIVVYRTENGPFQSVDDLVKVRGIGKRTLERNREVIQAVVMPDEEEKSSR